jgi:putative ABC transport system permease protein
VFEYQFFDETLDALYNNESKLMTLFTLFSAIALLISCLGLWGLITLMVNVRIKEIGVRKVLGASTAAIISLLTRDFVILVGISICMAVPLSYWSLHKWLQDFAYRVDIGWFVFAVAGATALAIAILTVALRSFRAAAASPVHSLRSE